MPKAVKRPQVLMYVVNALFWMTVYIYVPQFSAYTKNEIGATAAFVGLIAGSYGITQMLLRLPLGILSDKLRRRKPFILGGIAAGGLSSLLMFYFPQSPTMLFVGRLIAGLAACAYVQISILFSSYFEGTTHSMGFVEGSSATGQLIAMLIGGVIAGTIGYRYSFLASALVALPGLALAAFATESRKERQGFRLQDVVGTLTDRNLIVAAVLAIAAQGINFAKAFTFAPLAAASLAVPATQGQLSIMTICFMLPTAIFGPLVAGKVLPRFGMRPVVTTGFALHILACALVPFSGTIGLLYLSQLLTGLGNSLSFPSLMSLSVSRLPDEKRATAMGFYQAVYGLGIFAGPWLAGLLVDWFPAFQYNAAFLFTAVLAGFAAVASAAFIPSGIGRRARPAAKAAD